MASNDPELHRARLRRRRGRILGWRGQPDGWAPTFSDRPRRPPNRQTSGQARIHRSCCPSRPWGTFSATQPAAHPRSCRHALCTGPYSAGQRPRLLQGRRACQQGAALTRAGHQFLPSCPHTRVPGCSPSSARSTSPIARPSWIPFAKKQHLGPPHRILQKMARFDALHKHSGFREGAQGSLGCSRDAKWCGPKRRQRSV